MLRAFDTPLARSAFLAALAWLAGSGCNTASPRAAPIAVGSDAAIEAAASADSGTVDFVAPRPFTYGPLRIRDVQGVTHGSRLAGTLVRDLTGIVTCVLPDGFFMQDPEPDGDDRTSEGLFVSTSTAPEPTPGDAVRIAAHVQELRASCHDCSAGMGLQSYLSTTLLTAPRSVEILARFQRLPAPVRVGTEGRSVPNRVSTGGSLRTLDDPSTPLQPRESALGFYESLEGMRIELEQAAVVSPSMRIGGRTLVTLLPQPAMAVRTEHGGALITDENTNPARLLLGSAPEIPLPNAAVGAGFSAAVQGIVRYHGGRFELWPCAPLPPLLASMAVRETLELPALRDEQLSIASLNLQNLAATADSPRFAALAELIAIHLRAPDLLALSEIQDDNGAQNDTQVSSLQTLDRLTRAIVAAHGPAYQARWIDPHDDADGGQPGSNVRSVLLFRTDRGLQFVDRAGAGADTENSLELGSGSARLAFSPGRIAPADRAFRESRKPLAAEFSFRGRRLFVIAVHLVSKLGYETAFGRFEPPRTPSARQRSAQARAIAAFVDTLLAVEPEAQLMALGDFNDFEFSPALSPLKLAGLIPVIEMLPAHDRYSYVYDGNSQALDHIFVSPALLPRLAGVDAVHRHADFPTRITDHDPLVAYLSF